MKSATTLGVLVLVEGVSCTGETGVGGGVRSGKGGFRSQRRSSTDVVLNKKNMMEVSRGPGYILSLWL